VARAEVLFCTAKAGVQVLNASVLEDATKLKVAGDVNAVSPLGLEGIKLKDNGSPLLLAVNSPGSVGIGALAVGDVKYRLQSYLLALMLKTEAPVFLDFRDAFQRARELMQ
jgi:methylene-tetrahydromethanopterin dehydrogenase